MIKYRIDVYNELIKRGWTPKRIRQEKLLGQKTLQEIRQGKKECKGIKELNAVCLMLEKQPGSIIRFIPDQEQKTE